MKRASIFVVFMLAVAAMSALAGDDAAVKSDAAVTGGERVTLKGQLVCMACDLKHTADARAACKIYGHRHALKTADGKLISLLENKYAEDLIKGEAYSGKTLEIHGVYFANANMLDVESYHAEGGKETSWCNKCKKMDACAAKK